MKTARKIASQVVWFVVLTAAATVGVWYFFGTIQFQATFESSKLEGAKVMLDGKTICKTPCAYRPTPGYHNVVIVPPEGYETRESEWTYRMITFNLGNTITADFHVNDVIAPDDSAPVAPTAQTP